MTRTRMDIRGFTQRPAFVGGALAAACASAS
jgi:hypothetical protein